MKACLFYMCSAYFFNLNIGLLLATNFSKFFSPFQRNKIEDIFEYFPPVCLCQVIGYAAFPRPKNLLETRNSKFIFNFIICLYTYLLFILLYLMVGSLHIWM